MVKDIVQCMQLPNQTRIFCKEKKNSYFFDSLNFICKELINKKIRKNIQNIPDLSTNIQKGHDVEFLFDQSFKFPKSFNYVLFGLVELSQAILLVK